MEGLNGGKATPAGVVSRLGARGLYRGFGATLAREIPFGAIVLPLYPIVLDQLSRGDDQPTTATFLASGVRAGGVAAGATCPLDVVKTRLQLGGGAAGSVVRQILRDDGPRGFFRGVATGPECVELEGLFWDWLEREHPSVDRSRPATHAPHVFEALGYKNTGVVNTGSIGQSDFLWRARTLSRMVEAWRTVWGLSADERLLTSFDGAGVHRNPCHPAHAGRGVRTDQKWYHLDQSKPDFVGYQGVLTIFPATGKTGSTVVCPGSHKDHAENCARGGKQPRGPFVRRL